jgi:hypothetical protein
VLTRKTADVVPLKRKRLAARPASRALQALDGIAGEVRGGWRDGGADRPAGCRAGASARRLAAAAAIGAVTLGLKASPEEVAKADQSYRRLKRC